MLLGSHHVLVARTEYLVDLGHRLCAVGHSADGLHTTYLVYLADTCDAGCYQNGWIHLAFTIRWGAQYDFLAACYLGGCGQHQHCREEGSGAAGDIETYALNSHTLLPAGDTFLCLYLLSYKALRYVEHLDVVVSQDDGVAQLVAHQPLGFLHLLFRYGQVVQLCLVKLQLVIAYGFVAPLLDVVQHGADSLVQLRQVQSWALYNLAPLLLLWISVYLHYSLLITHFSSK